MSEIAIETAGVWKKFHRGEMHDSLRDLIPAMARRLVGRRPPRDELREGDFWALRDVNFEVRRGEALGIIGPNGAGKSTMLKTLTRILRPTRGRCEIRGRVGALIEVGAGFHPDLTGRENVYLQGAIMGMRREEIRHKLDSIVDFAGVGAFVDTPVKRYSSGMNARLGFSVAAHLEPDVLVIDEVLSVGDMAYQQKCVDRMLAFKREGVAIAFVSHNMQAVSALCDRAVFLKSSVAAIGPVHDVIAKYLETATASAPTDPSAAFTLQSASLTDRQGNPVSIVATGTPLTLRVECLSKVPLSGVTVSFVMHRSTDGLLVYDGNYTLEELGTSRVNAGDRFELAFNFVANVTRGQYHFQLDLFNGPTTERVLHVNPVALLRVDEARTFAGVANLAAQATLHSKNDAPSN